MYGGDLIPYDRTRVGVYKEVKDSLINIKETMPKMLYKDLNGFEAVTDFRKSLDETIYYLVWCLEEFDRQKQEFEKAGLIMPEKERKHD